MFGTTSIPVPDTSVSSVRHAYRYRAYRYRTEHTLNKIECILVILDCKLYTPIPTAGKRPTTMSLIMTTVTELIRLNCPYTWLQSGMKM